MDHIHFNKGNEEMERAEHLCSKSALYRLCSDVSTDFRGRGFPKDPTSAKILAHATALPWLYNEGALEKTGAFGSWSSTTIKYTICAFLHQIQSNSHVLLKYGQEKHPFHRFFLDFSSIFPCKTETTGPHLAGSQPGPWLRGTHGVQATDQHIATGVVPGNVAFVAQIEVLRGRKNKKH